ncbi:hypothetical protein B9Y64_06710 [Stenotrophomonas maltophilia]|uniref:Uncharacterized protein n=2 Tax=Lysobacteraceae TaxID=32033 RepID=A0A2J0UCU3_STEMA|nr:hypothetical protein B9Y64_06710 [Stenotrophomonas maltophilia]
MGIAFVVAALSASAAPHPAFTPSAGFSITDGTLYRGKAAIASHFSISRTGIGYLFVYVPQFGLITLSTSTFPGAQAHGRIEKQALRFDADGEAFVLTSESPLLASGESVAWVSVDRTFALRGKRAVVAYGDDPGMPYDWPMREVARK